MSDNTLNKQESVVKTQKAQSQESNQDEFQLNQNQSTIQQAILTLQKNDKFNLHRKANSDISFFSTLSARKESFDSTVDYSRENIEIGAKIECDNLKERYLSLKKEMELLEQQKREQVNITYQLNLEIKQLKEINLRQGDKEDKLDLSTYKIEFYKKILSEQQQEFSAEKKSLKKTYETKINKLKDNLEEKCKEQAIQINLLKEELEKQKKEYGQLLLEKNAEQTKNEILVKELQSKGEEIVILQNEKEILSLKLEEIKCKNQEKEIKILKLQDKIDNNNATILEQQENINELKKENQEQKLEIEDLKKTNEEQKKINEEQKKTIEEYNTKIQKLKEKIEEFDLVHLQIKIEAAREQLYFRFIEHYIKITGKFKDCHEYFKDEENRIKNQEDLQKYVNSEFGVSNQDWQIIVQDKQDRYLKQKIKHLQTNLKKEIILIEFFDSDSPSVLEAYKNLFEAVYRK